MGEVLLARDPQLERYVAIKLLFDRGEGHAERLLFEARATARCKHDNIVVIHQVDKHEGRPYMVLEYLEGQTLREWMQEDRSQGIEREKRVTTLMLPVARALAYAHQRSIVHRDLKPENIMLTDAGATKVLDFGIAKGLRGPPIIDPASESRSAAATSTFEPVPNNPTTGSVSGTLAYMAPEQFRAMKVDHRCDLWAFGIILHELLFDRHPLADADKDPITALADFELPVPAVTECGPAMANLINGCLKKRADDRIGSAFEVVAALEEMQAQWAAEATPPPIAVQTSPPQTFSRRAAIVVTVLVGLAIAFAGGQTAITKPELPYPNPTIVLTDVINRTPEADLGNALATAFRIGIKESAYARIVGREHVQRLRTLMKLTPRDPLTRKAAVDLCFRARAGVVVELAVDNADGPYRLSATIIDPVGTRPDKIIKRKAATRDEVVSKLGELTYEVRKLLGEPEELLRLFQPLAYVTTADLSALRAYSLAMQEDRRSNVQYAAEQLEFAIQLDPGFAIARAKLGTLYYSRLGKMKEGLAHWKRALETKDRLSQRERLYLQGTIAWTGEPQQMADRWATYREHYPAEPAGHANGALVASWHFGRFEDAVQAHERVAEIDSSIDRNYRSLGFNLMALRRYDEAFDAYQKATALNESPGRGGFADVLIAQMRHDEAVAYLQRTANATDIPGGNYALERVLKHALIAGERGQIDAALRALEDAKSHTRGRILDDVRVLMAQATMRAQSKQHGDPRLPLRAIVELLMPALEGDGPLMARPVPHLALAASQLVRCGAVGEAQAVHRRLSAQVEAHPIAKWQAYLMLLEGELMALEDPSAAVDIFDRGLDIMDLYPLHFAAARGHQKAGDNARALNEVDWISTHRGQALAEHVDRFFGREMRLLDWGWAKVQQIQLLQATGRLEEAARHQQQLTKLWRDADPEFLPAAALRTGRQ